MSPAPDPEKAGRVTLGQASKALGRPTRYFQIRRARYRNRAELPFPEPVDHVAGFEVFDLAELAVWDERRKKLPASRRRTKTSEKEG